MTTSSYPLRRRPTYADTAVSCQVCVRRRATGPSHHTGLADDRRSDVSIRTGIFAKTHTSYISRLDSLRLFTLEYENFMYYKLMSLFVFC